MRNTNTVEYFSWGCRNTAEINNAGRITKKAKQVFTSGQCHALALALHELSGLPLVGFWDDNTGPLEDTPNHTAVQMANRTVLDIEGPFAEMRWLNCSVFEVTKVEVLDFENKDYLTPNVEAALPYARTLLRKYGIEFKPKETLNDQSNLEANPQGNEETLQETSSFNSPVY